MYTLKTIAIVFILTSIIACAAPQFLVVDGGLTDSQCHFKLSLDPEESRFYKGTCKFLKNENKENIYTGYGRLYQYKTYDYTGEVVIYTYESSGKQYLRILPNGKGSFAGENGQRLYQGQWSYGYLCTFGKCENGKGVLAQYDPEYSIRRFENFSAGIWENGKLRKLELIDPDGRVWTPSGNYWFSPEYEYDPRFFNQMSLCPAPNRGSTQPAFLPTKEIILRFLAEGHLMSIYNFDKNTILITSDQEIEEIELRKYGALIDRKEISGLRLTNKELVLLNRKHGYDATLRVKYFCFLDKGEQ